MKSHGLVFWMMGLCMVLGCLVLGGIMAGCQPEEQAVAPVSEDRPVELALLYNRSDYPEDIVITEHGLFDYWENTPFSSDSLKAALPGFEIVEATDGSEGQSWDVLNVMKGRTKLLQVDSDFLGNVGKVSTSSSLVGIDTGHKVGQEYSSVFSGSSVPSCFPGIEELSGNVICEAPNRTQIYYIFSGTWDGPDGRLPPPDVMATWTIRSVFWTSK